MPRVNSNESAGNILHVFIKDVRSFRDVTWYTLRALGQPINCLLILVAWVGILESLRSNEQTDCLHMHRNNGCMCHVSRAVIARLIERHVEQCEEFPIKVLICRYRKTFSHNLL